MIGTIYKIVHTQSDICYVGMTLDKLAKRWQKHKDNCKNDHPKCQTSIYPYMREYGIENFRIMPIKSYDVVDRQHLKVYETLWINKLRCINDIPSFSPITKKQRDKLYHEANRDKIREYHKSWYQNNKTEQVKKVKAYCEANRDKVKEKNRQYYQANKEAFAVKQKTYREKNSEVISMRKKEWYEKNRDVKLNKDKVYRETNRDAIRAKANEKIECPCGGQYSRSNKSYHEKSKRHQEFKEIKA